MSARWCHAALALSTAASLVLVAYGPPGSVVATEPVATPVDDAADMRVLRAEPPRSVWPTITPAAAPLTLPRAGAASGLTTEPPDASPGGPPLPGTSPDDPPAGDGGGADEPLGALTPLSSLPSARYEATISLLQEGGLCGTLIVLLEYSQDPAAQRLQVVFRDLQGHESVRVDEVRVGQRAYSYTGDAQDPWMAAAASSAPELLDVLGRMSWLLDPQVIVGDSEPEWSRQERLGGSPATRYHYGVRAVRSTWWTQMDLPTPEAMSMDVWVSRDHGALAGLEVSVLSGRGAGRTEFSVQATLGDVGDAVVIREPEVCAPQELPADVPVLPDAVRLTEHCGVWTYQTALTAEDVAGRYRELLWQRGWRLVVEESVPPALLLFLKNGRTVSVRTDQGPATTYVILDMGVPESR